MTTLSRLQSDVDSWLARDDISTTANTIDTILKLAEANIARDVRTVAQERNVTLSAAARQTVAPTNFLEARWLGLDSNNQPRIEYMTPEVIRKEPAWGSGTVITFYTIEGLIGSETDEDVYFTWAPAGSASAATSIELGYYRRFTALADGSDTNWLLTNHYDVYLWAMLHAAGIFLQEDGLMANYGGKYDMAREALAKSENRKRFRGQTKKSYNSPRVIV